jgi:hypothetical protein
MGDNVADSSPVGRGPTTHSHPILCKSFLQLKIF